MKGMDVAWDGAVNARKINNCVVRMARHEWVTPDGWQQILDDGFTTVVDLRSPYEWQITRDGDHGLPPWLRRRINLVSAPTEDPDHPQFRKLLGPYLDHPRHYATYLELFGDKVAAALLAVAGAPGGVIVHCSAGRDRTGLIVALGQRLAGWSDDAIVEGYAEAAAGINELHRTNPHPTEKFMEGEVWDSWLGDRLLALREFLAGLDPADVLTRAGLNSSDLERIRSRFAVSNR